MSSSFDDTKTQLAGMLAVAALTGAAFWIGEGLKAAIVPFAAVLAVALVVALGRSRSDAIETMSGLGDERVRTNYRRAAAFASNVMSCVVPGWWLITVAQGAPNQTLAGVAAIFGLSWVAGAVFYARRG